MFSACATKGSSYRLQLPLQDSFEMFVNTIFNFITSEGSVTINSKYCVIGLPILRPTKVAKGLYYTNYCFILENVSWPTIISYCGLVSYSSKYRLLLRVNRLVATVIRWRLFNYNRERSIIHKVLYCYLYVPLGKQAGGCCGGGKLPCWGVQPSCCCCCCGARLPCWGEYSGYYQIILIILIECRH